MNKKSDKNSDLFKKAMRDVTPLKDPNKISLPQPKKAKLKKPAQEFDESQIPLSDHCSEEITHDQFLSYAKAGVQPRYFKQLKQGKIAIEAELDLHGLNLDAARSAFTEFMALGREQGLRCVRIIHGKGYRAQRKTPLLKTKVYTWLLQMPNILAFCSCQPKDGGTGAVYVLFERQK